jgi:predicted Zn-dependent protease
MHLMFTQQMGVHQDLELQEYVQRVGEKLAAVSERPDLDWHFTIVDTDDVNAFATMGGYVYISRGILPYFQNEADLAAVLGHEIGHITAEHLKKQNRKGMLSGLASAATAIFTGMPALADLTNMAGQAIISGYGREAELESDRLGASYLAKAGYDPEAMIHVISTLKDQDTFERERARLEGREPRIYHGTFASHPSNDTRLQQAIGAAGRNAAAATGNASNTEGFLQAIEGLPVGSSARQGMVRENRFYHSDMQFTLAFPQGWQVVNQPEKILAIAPNKEHYMEIRAQPPPADLTDPQAFALRGLANKRLARTSVLDVNGLKGWTGIVRGDPSPFGQSTNVRYVVIYYGNLMWIFKGASRSGMEAPSGDPFFLSTANTFRRMRGNEFALAEPHRLHIVRAAEGTTIEALAEQSPVKKYPQQQLRLFNKLYPDGEPKPGDLVKTVR